MTRVRVRLTHTQSITFGDAPTVRYVLIRCLSSIHIFSFANFWYFYAQALQYPTDEKQNVTNNDN